MNINRAIGNNYKTQPPKMSFYFGTMTSLKTFKHQEAGLLVFEGDTSRGKWAVVADMEIGFTAFAGAGHVILDDVIHPQYAYACDIGPEEKECIKSFLLDGVARKAFDVEDIEPLMARLDILGVPAST